MITPPHEDDMGDSLHGYVYARLQRIWIEQVNELFLILGRFEADGATTASMADMIEVRWCEASEAMHQFTRFARQHSDVLSAGSPTAPDAGACARCRQTKDRTGDLCFDCLVIVLSGYE